MENIIELINGNTTKKFNNNLTDDQMVMTVINLLTAFMCHTTDRTLKRFAKQFNCLDEYAKELYFKMEYYFTSLMITAGKKNYASILRILEGKLIDPSELDVKGLTMKKTSLNAIIGKMCQNVTEHYLLRRTKDFNFREFIQANVDNVNTIRDMVTSGDQSLYFVTKLAQPSSQFTSNNYRNESVKLWNAIVPGQGQIDTPGVFKMVDISLDVESLKKNHKDVYKGVVKYIKKSKFIKTEGLDTEGIDKLFKKISRIAIPMDMDVTPAWILEHINVEQFTSKYIAAMKPILKALNISLYIKPGSKIESYSNIVSINSNEDEETGEYDLD